MAAFLTKLSSKNNAQAVTFELPTNFVIGQRVKRVTSCKMWRSSYHCVKLSTPCSGDAPL